MPRAVRLAIYIALLVTGPLALFLLPPTWVPYRVTERYAFGRGSAGQEACTWPWWRGSGCWRGVGVVQSGGCPRLGPALRHTDLAGYRDPAGIALYLYISLGRG